MFDFLKISHEYHDCLPFVLMSFLWSLTLLFLPRVADDFVIQQRAVTLGSRGLVGTGHNSPSGSHYIEDTAHSLYVR